MRCLNVGLVVLALLFASPAARAAETEVESRIVSVGLFKNGLAVVKRLVAVPDEGTYLVTNVPHPVHGTFWVESDAVVETKVTSRLVDVPARLDLGADLQQSLAGKRVVIHFRDGNIQPAVGTMEDMSKADGKLAWDRRYEQDYRPYYWWGWSPRSTAPSATTPPKRFLVLRTEKGLTCVDSNMIAYLQADGEAGAVKSRRPVLSFRVTKAAKKPATIVLTYLTKGMAWAPSYRVDISDQQKLTIEQKAVIRNELADVDDAEIELISGFPSVQFSHVLSPLCPEANWAGFFQSLSRRVQQGHPSMSNVATQQAISYNVRDTGAGADMSAIPTGEGVDLHYQPIGKRSLKEGDSLALSIAKAQAAYERVVEWIIPDTRDALGRYVSEWHRRERPEEYEEDAWDAVQFKNPFDFPMTTAAAMVIANDRFNGQRMSYWVNPGEQTVVRVTKALSVRTRHVEHEEKGQREVVYIGGWSHRRSTVKCELAMCNHRKEPIKLIIRRRFSGRLIDAEGEPKCELREEGVYSVNERNELTWVLTLKPGEERKLKYSLSIMVRI